MRNRPFLTLQRRFAGILVMCSIAGMPFSISVKAQSNSEKGLPFITNYSPKIYKAYPQTWCVQEDESGIMYFGIQGYILEYDGVKWNKIPLLKSAVRSMARHKDGLIYFGGFTDLGYLDNDSLGQKKAYSLFDLIPAENRNFLDVWTTHSTESGVYFQAREYIFRLEDKKPGVNEKRKVKVWKPATRFMYSFYLDKNYYVHQQSLGLFKMVNDSLVLLPGSEFLGKERMQIMLPYKTATNEKQYLIGMFYGGLYLFNGTTFQPFVTKADPIIKSGSLLYKGLLLKNGNYVLSTTGKGLVIIDAQGNLLQKLNREVGLQDESVYANYQDKKGTLWLGLDNGISRVEIASPLTQFTLQSGINTGVLNITRFDGNLYIGTTNGLLVYNNKTSFFDPVPGIIQNQIFALLPDGKQLLVPGDGLFAVRDKKTTIIKESVSADLALSGLYISKKYPDILFGGGTFGVAVFTRPSGHKISNESAEWLFAGFVPGITDQIWSFSENKDGTIWAGTQAGSVYKIVLAINEKEDIDLSKTKFEKYGAEHGFKDGTGQVYNIKGVNYFFAENSLYTFDDQKKQFIPDSTFGNFKKGGGNSEYEMAEDQQGRVWIRFGKETRLAIPKPGGGYRFDDSQLSTIKELTIQKIYPESNGIVWICTTDGLIRYDENLEKNIEQSYKTVIRFASAGKNLLSTAVAKDSKSVSVSYINNTLRFEYAAPFFDQEDKTQYQTWLEGFEKDWSDFGFNYYKEYTNIPAGDYHFRVRAKNVFQKLSEEAVYHFSIYPPWYATWWAYALYALAGLAIIYALIRWRTHQLHEKHRELEKTVADRTKQLSHRVEELAVINSVQEGLVREMDMQGIYELVGEKIREIFNAQVIDIVTYDAKTNLLDDRYAYEKGDRTLVGTWEPSGFRKQVIDSGQLLLINEDLANKSIQFSSNVIHGEIPKSAVFVPMISGGTVTGMISLQNLDRENAFSVSSVSLLTTLANSMSVALESARRFDETTRLLKETEQRNAELAVINSVQDGLVREMDIQGIYYLVGEKIREIFDAQVIDIVTYDRKTNLIDDKYAYEKGDRTLLDPREPKGFRKYIIETGEQLVINENAEEISKQYNNQVMVGEQPKSLVMVPMITGGQVTGIISLQNVDHDNAFSDSNVRLINTLANSMSIALESARLFDETKRLLKETEQRNAELAVINSVQDGLVREMDIQGIYYLVGEKIREIFDAQVIDIVTYDKKTNLVEDKYSYEKGDRTLLGPREPSGFRKHIIGSGEQLVINENAEKIGRQYNNQVMVGEEPKSLVLVPMITSGQVTGIISLQNVDREHAFSDSNVRLINTLANSMSIALEGARLFDETKRLLKETEQRTAELSVINSVQEGLAKELNIQGIYELVGEKMREIFNAQVIDIVTYDSITDLMEDRYSFEKGDRTLAGTWKPGGFRKRVIDTGRLLVINEGLDEKSIEFNSQVLLGQQPKSAVFVPLISGNEVKGMISLQNLDTEHAFSDSDINLLTTLANSMSVALESARLFDETNRLLKETEQRTAELAVINSVQDGLAKELDMQGIYDLVGDRVQKLFNAQVVIIATFDHEKKLEYFNYHIEKEEITHPEPRHFDKVRQHLIETGQNIMINENFSKAAAEFGMKVVPGTEAPKSLLFMPLKVGDKVTGYVSLQNIDQEHAFSFSDVRLLGTLSNSMSVALENARLFDETTRLLKETEQRTAELSVINSVQDGLARELDIQGIYEMVGEKMREIFKAQVIDIVMYDRTTNLLEDKYSYEKGDRTLLQNREPKGFRKHVIETGEMLLNNDNVEEACRQYNNEVLIGEMPKSQIFFPLMASGKVSGIISLQNLDKEHAFSESDVSLITTLANSMSVALESARLFDETNRLLKETEQRNAELGVINSVQEGLVREMDIQGIYDLVGEKIREIFSAQVIDIVTYDRNTNLIEDKYAFEKGDRTLVGPREPRGFRKHVIETGEMLLHNENVEEASRQYNNEVLFGEMSKSQIFFPLIASGKVNGIISLQNLDHEHAFSESDVNLITTLANSMSVALESARLFDETNRLLKETEQRTAELSVINSVQEGLAKVLSIQGIYQLVGEKIREIFNAQVIDITTYDRKSNLIEDRYGYEKGDRTLVGPRIPKGFRKHVIETSQVLVINQDIEKYMKKYDNVVMHGEASKSVVFVPMIAGGEVTGIISLQNLDQENAFSDSEVSLLKTLANSMTVALESARLFAETTRLLSETEQRTAELSVINSVQEGLARELDIQGIYELVGEKMRDIFNAQVIDIVTYDKTNNTIEDRYTYEDGDRTLLGPRPLKGFRKHVIETAKLLVINKDLYQQRSKYDQSVIIGKGAKSIVLVPMIASGEVTGVISLQNIDQENAFSASDVNLLSTLSNSMSVALESARLFDETTRLLKETEQRTGELSVINSVQEGLAKELDMQGIYDLIGDRVQKLFNAQSVIIATFDLDNKIEHFNYAIENGKKFHHESRPINKLRKLLIEKRRSIYIPTEEIAKTDYGLSALAGTKMSKSLLFVPLLTGTIIRGYVSLQNVDIEYAFSESDIRLLETLANSMSVALENARLFDETNRLLKETEQRTAELGIINSVQEGLASKLDIQAVYDLVGDKIRDVFDTQGISISFYDRQKNFITHPYYLFKGKRIEELGFELGKGLTSHIIQTAQPLLINEHAAERFKELGAVFAASETEETTKSWLGVPLISGGKVNGTIRLENYQRENAYSESDVFLLQTLANSMSVALENARLFDETTRLLKETEQRKAELAVINNVQEGLVKEFKSKEIYELVGVRLCELFDTQTVLIRTFDHENGTETWRYAMEKGVRQFTEPRPLIWANKKLIETHKPILINKDYVETAKKFGGTGVSMGQPPKSAVFVPMIVGDIVRGSVSLQNVDKENAFTESDLGLLTTLTNSMGVALENARLFDETTTLLAEAKQRATELSTVNSISKALASQLDPDDLIKMVGDELKKLFNANIVYLALLDPKNKIINFPYQFGDNMEPLKLGEGLTSKIILTGEPILINKNLSEQRKQMGIQLVGLESASYLGVPIPVGEENIGVLSVQSTEHENLFNENDLRLLSTIGSSVGVALRNATLFEDVQQAKMEAETASKLAEKANEAKSAFLSTVSHELRTPLTSVLGFAKIIKKRLEERIFPLVDKTDAKTEKAVSQVSENLHVVISEGTRLTHLINDVLDLAKIEAGKMEFAQENVSMFEVAERALAATTSLFDQKVLKLIRKIDADLPEVIGDKDKLIQVMINLISNSVKFTDQGSITCSVRLVKNEIIVSIADTGIGIAPEDFGAVFEQFKQVGGDTLTDKPKGTGLGLPICKEIVEHLGGRIWLESEIGKGSTFSFALPINKTVSAERPIYLNDLVKQLKEKVAYSQLNLKGIASNILIVDDDESIRSLLHQELGDAGYVIDEASNGKEALACVRKQRPDLIILDIMMPEMNGFDVAAVLKNDPETMDIPIIVLSVVQDKARGFRIGVDRYLTKPIDTGLLFAEIGNLLEQGKSKKKVLVVDQDSATVKTLTEVLKTKGYEVTESNEKELMEKAVANQPDIIIINSVLSGKQDIVQTLRFEKGLENVLFLVYQ